MLEYSKQICGKIIKFRGVFMRDTLPQKSSRREIGILNLDSVHNNGTHWTLFYKNNNKCFYFDSFGYGPPEELSEYFKKNIVYSTYKLQEIGTNSCGALCLELMKNIVRSKDFLSGLIMLINDK